MGLPVFHTFRKHVEQFSKIHASKEFIWEVHNRVCGWANNCTTH